MPTKQRFLAIYAGILSVVCAVNLLSGFAAHDPKKNFDEITAKRINVIESDGTLRMVISSRDRFPGLIVKGKEYPHDRKVGGILFFDDEGTENGGLIFDGKGDGNSKGSSSGHLSFDRYMGDQVFAIWAEENQGQYESGLTINEHPDFSYMEYLEESKKWVGLPEKERQARRKAFMVGKPTLHVRINLGRDRDSSAALRLKDKEGHNRIVIMVRPDGTPILQFLDQQGKIISQLPPTKN